MGRRRTAPAGGERRRQRPHAVGAARPHLYLSCDWNARSMLRCASATHTTCCCRLRPPGLRQAAAGRCQAAGAAACGAARLLSRWAERQGAVCSEHGVAAMVQEGLWQATSQDLPRAWFVAGRAVEQASMRGMRLPHAPAEAAAPASGAAAAPAARPNLGARRPAAPDHNSPSAPAGLLRLSSRRCKPIALARAPVQSSRRSLSGATACHG